MSIMKTTIIRWIILKTLMIMSTIPGISQVGFEELDANNIKARINANGVLFWDTVSQPVFRVPKDSQTNTIFAGGLWAGGIDPGGVLRLAAQTYNQNGDDFWPGILDSSGSIIPPVSQQWNEVWKISRTDLNAFLSDASDGSIDNAIPSSILDWPATGNPHNPIAGNQEAAPFVDVNFDGVYNPLDMDYPLIKGDQMLWWAYNDQLTHTESGGNAIGMEIHCSAYAFESTDSALNNTIFMNYRLINKSGTDLDSFFVGKWVDFDLGCFDDDYVGCDTLQNSFFAYNGDSIDDGCVSAYQEIVPVQSLTFLNRKMSAFLYYNNDFSVTGNPQIPQDYYGYMTGTWKDSLPWEWGGDGYAEGTFPTRHVFSGYPGNPIPSLWSECNEGNTPGDRRGLGSIGPFDFNNGQQIDMDVAYITSFPYVKYDACFSSNYVWKQRRYIQEYYDCPGTNCVWPGDADNNGVTSMWDLLPIGIGFGSSGSFRNNASYAWYGQNADDWGIVFSSGADYKHADSDGNGIIDFTDAFAIYLNYTLIHNKASGLKGGPDDPALFVDIQQDTAFTGTAFDVDVHLGTADIPADSVHGIAFSLLYDPALVDTNGITVDFSKCWIGDSLSTITMYKDIYHIGRIDIGITRIDQQNISGHGILVELKIVVIDNIEGKYNQVLNIRPDQVKMIDRDEADRPFNAETDSIFILGNGPVIDKHASFEIFPNPANDVVMMKYPGIRANDIRFVNILGQVIHQPESIPENQAVIPVSHLEQGLYFVQLRTDQGTVTRRLIIGR